MTAIQAASSSELVSQVRFCLSTFLFPFASRPPQLTPHPRPSSSLLIPVLALTEKHQLMKGVKNLLKTEYKWEEAWINGVTAAIMTRRLDTTVDKTKAAVDYLASLGIPIHRVENMVSINTQILARTVDELKETVAHLEGKGISGDELGSFLMTNPVILRYGPVDSSVLALRKAGGLDAKSMAKVVTDGTGLKQCVYYRQGVVLGKSPISMTLT